MIDKDYLCKVDAVMMDLQIFREIKSEIYNIKKSR